MVIFGLTGGIGSGKSLVASYFRKFFRAAVFDADKVVHELYNFDKNVIELVKLYFPDSVNNGVVDRSSLKNHFFAYSQLWIKFQSALHLRVLEKQRDFISLHNRRLTKYAVLDVPLLIESNFHNHCSFIIHIKTSKLLQKQRVLKRGVLQKEFEFINMVQLSENNRRKFSDFSIKTGLGAGYILFQIKRIMLSISNNSNGCDK
ncbi:dephospho-CoA kinase [Ehrlichia sp. JZT12]